MRRTPSNRCSSRVLLAFATIVLCACRGGSDARDDERFFTSGSREADQRASQRMAKAEQLEGTGDEEAKATEASARESRTLFERLGGGEGLRAIAADFLPRAIQDPRVDWSRAAVKRGGWLGRKAPPPWDATDENVALLSERFVQFLALATGGPARYDGRDLEAVHGSMRISNPEFDAVLGDLKASLDKLGIADQEQKELLAILESTRPQIVTER
jgi:hemoglobin